MRGSCLALEIGKLISTSLMDCSQLVTAGKMLDNLPDNELVNAWIHELCRRLQNQLRFLSHVKFKSNWLKIGSSGSPQLKH